MEDPDQVQHIGTFRRVLPQVTEHSIHVKQSKIFLIWIILGETIQLFAASAKNLMVVNVGNFHGFPSIVIPSLIGASKALNPDETLHVTAAQTSWLCEWFVNLLKLFEMLDLKFMRLQLVLLT